MVASTRVPISYQLVIEVRSPVRCQVGRLGVVDFPPGTYACVGLAALLLRCVVQRAVR